MHKNFVVKQRQSFCCEMFQSENRKCYMMPFRNDFQKESDLVGLNSIKLEK